MNPTVRRMVPWLRFAAIALVALAIWLPRGLELDRFVTPDEPTWLTRSANFYHALSYGEFEYTKQYVHPGVTTMWVGAAAFFLEYPTYAHDAAGQMRNEWRNPLILFPQTFGHEPLELLATSRAILVIFITAILSAALFLAQRLLGFWLALFGFLMIAFDPFHIAMSRLLHLDGLLATLMLLSVLAMLRYLGPERRRRYLYISAIAAGLACLTRSTALMLAPFVALLMGIEFRRQARFENRSFLRELGAAARPFFAWLVIGMAVFVLLWPAMWVDPVDSLTGMFTGEVVDWAMEGHEFVVFFDGAVFEGDPGFSFYPVTYLWRATPIVLAGLVLAITSLLAWRRLGVSEEHRRIMLSLILFAVLFTVAYSLGAKKFDRYLIPIYLPLDIVAAFGWFTVVRGLWKSRFPIMRAAAPGLLALAIVVQAGSAISTFPYYLTYYNPLMGGAAKASEVMMIGWGEGVDQVAEYLNEQQGAEQLTVVTTSWAVTLAYLFDGTTQAARFVRNDASLQQWQDADYYVLYINQLQRERVPPELLAYFAGLTPELTIKMEGLDYAWLYDVSNVPVPDYFFEMAASTADRATAPDT